MQDGATPHAAQLTIDYLANYCNTKLTQQFARFKSNRKPMEIPQKPC